ncbi:MAG: glucosamine-6-phosphate deaminase [Pseudomonadota bacterium]
MLIFQTAQAAVDRVVLQIVDQLSAKPGSVLGLATGGTMEPVYESLVAAYAAGSVSFAQATTFNLDEYVGLGPNHPCSFSAFMNDRLFGRVDADRARTHLPKGDAADPDAEAARYDALIGRLGPIDLQLLGIGANGHIGFNEPTSSLRSRTRVKTLTSVTREANKRFFADGEATPKYAITVGIENIMECATVMLLATGQGKAQAVADTIEGPLGAFCPATALQMHPDTTIVLDREAAGALKFTDYYSQVHPDGQDAPYG